MQLPCISWCSRSTWAAFAMTDPYPRGWIVVAAGAVDIVVSALIVVLCFRRIYGAAGPADARVRSLPASATHTSAFRGRADIDFCESPLSRSLLGRFRG